jgi:hypothetical protein
VCIAGTSLIDPLDTSPQTNFTLAHVNRSKEKGGRQTLAYDQVIP